MHQQFIAQMELPLEARGEAPTAERSGEAVPTIQEHERSVACVATTNSIVHAGHTHSDGVASTLATPFELTALSVKRGLLEQLVQNPPKEFQHQRERDSEKRQLRFRWLLLEAYLHCVSPFRSGIDERAEI